MRRFLFSLLLAFGVLACLNAEDAGAITAERTLDSVSQIASTNWGASTVLHVLSYYDGGGLGGGDFLKASGSCTTTVTGDISSGSNIVTNLSSPAVYNGEKISAAPAVPVGTTFTSTSFNRVLSAGTWTNGSTTISNVPDTTNILVGMSLSAVRQAVSAKVASKHAPSTIITVHGSIHNEQVIHVTSAAGITNGMFVTAVANNDAGSAMKAMPESMIVPGVTVSGVSGTDVTVTGSLGISGVASDVTFRFTSTDGTVTVSSPSTGAEASETPVLFYQYNATMSANAASTTSAASLGLNGFDGGTHFPDSAGNCFVRQDADMTAANWGVKFDNSTDSTAFWQNYITYNSQSTQPGPAGSLKFPSNVSGISKASTLWMVKPVNWNGYGRASAIIQQTDGQAALTPLIRFFSLYDPTNLYSATYLSMDTEMEGMTLRGPNDMANTIGLYLDGYNGAPSPPQTDNSRVFFKDLTIDNFKSFGLYNARLSGVVGNYYMLQIHGVGTDNDSNDCLHSDGGDTWGGYKGIFSACDNGVYASSPSSWAPHRWVAFSNNHGATITGSVSANITNAQLNIYDFEYGFNKKNGIVIDSDGLRVSLEGAHVNDSGQVGCVDPTLCSDIEITANATISNGPVLTLARNFFAKVNSEAGAENHLLNIIFDDGATANVAVDATTTTSSTANILWNNLDTCDGGSGPGTCTASITSPPALYASGTGLISKVVNDSGGTKTLTASDCGTYFSLQAAPQTYNLPVAPSNSCALTFSPRSQTITLNPNGNQIQNAYGSARNTSLVLPATSSNNRAYFTLEWGNDGTWYIGPSSASLVTTLFPPVGQLIAHGQVYLSYCVSSCGPGGALSNQFQLCPMNGPGGLVVNLQMRSVPTTCAFLPNTATTSSAMNYIYAGVGNQQVSAIADNGSGKAELTVSSTQFLQNGTAVTCYNMIGTPLANVTNDANVQLVDATHFTLTDVNFVANGGGQCQWVGLFASTSTHTTVNGIEVSNATSSQTFVGGAYVGAANAVTDCSTPGPSCNVASWFNRKPKKLKVACGASVTTGNGTSTTTYKTPATLCEGDFTVLGPTASPGTYPTDQIHWFINGAVANSFLAGTEGTSACFGTSAQSTNNTCTAEAEEAFSTQAVATDYQGANVVGVTPTVTKGHNFMDLAGFCTGTTPTCTYNNGHTTIGMEIWQ